MMGYVSRSKPKMHNWDVAVVLKNKNRTQEGFGASVRDVFGFKP